MPLLLPPLISQAAGAAASVVRSWDRFWFEPLDPFALGLLRLLSGAMLVYTHAVWGLELEAFFGPAGWQDELLVRVQQSGSGAQSFWWYVPDGWRVTVHASCLTLLTLYTLGVWTRITSIAAFVIVVSYAHRAMNANFGLDQVNTLLTFVLMIGPSGRCLSVDRWWSRRRMWSGEPCRLASARVATRLLQIQLCLIYLFAGLAKLKGDSWWDGTAIWLAAANAEYQTGDLTWIAWYPWVGNLITHVTVLWELTFLFLIWNPVFRPWLLLVGVLMHLGIGAFLGMWTFGIAMILTYIGFIPPELLRTVFRWAGRPRPPRPLAAHVLPESVSSDEGLEAVAEWQTPTFENER